MRKLIVASSFAISAGVAAIVGMHWHSAGSAFRQATADEPGIMVLEARQAAAGGRVELWRDTISGCRYLRIDDAMSIRFNVQGRPDCIPPAS